MSEVVLRCASEAVAEPEGRAAWPRPRIATGGPAPSS